MMTGRQLGVWLAIVVALAFVNGAFVGAGLVLLLVVTPA